MTLRYGVFPKKWLLTLSVNMTPVFKEPGSSLSCSKNQAISFYTESFPTRVLQHSKVSKIYFNIIPFTPMSLT
jgi:hypothetical protein